MDLREKMRARLPKAAAGWYEIKAEGGRAVVRLYSEIGYFGVTAQDFVNELSQLTASEIEVQINSPGGDVFDGIAIYNALRAHSARVVTRVDGLAASAASLIVQAGDHRIMMSSAQLMIHEAWGVAIGPAADMRDFADLLDKQNDVLAGVYATRSGGDVEALRALMAAETWMTDQEAVDAGLADEVFTPPRQESNARVNDDQIRAAVAAELERLGVEPRVSEEPPPPVGINQDAARTLLAAFSPMKGTPS